MGDQTGWWEMLTGSPFFLALASALVALLIRDLLDPRQWQRHVRKVFAGVVSSIVVFAAILAGLLWLSQQIGDENNTVFIFVDLVALVGILSVTALAIAFAFNRIEPNVDWYMNSRFRYSFRNESWPILSVAVRSECLPGGATFISGSIVAVRGSVGEYRLRVTVGTASGTISVLDRTSSSPGFGWERVMRAVLNAQLGAFQPNPGWKERIRPIGRFIGWLERSGPNTSLVATRRYQWQNRACLQIHSLAQRVDCQWHTIMIIGVASRTMQAVVPSVMLLATRRSVPAS